MRLSLLTLLTVAILFPAMFGASLILNDSDKTHGQLIAPASLEGCHGPFKPGFGFC